VALLRGSNKPVVCVANKVDNADRALQATELFSLGIQELVNVSALRVKLQISVPPMAT
jgi:predicted GTPase